jgi:predicted peptidase
MMHLSLRISLVAMAFLSVSRPPTLSGQTLPLPPGTHTQTLRRTDGPEIRYAISIPPKYSPARHVPLILALHFAGGPGSGRGVLESLVRPALADLGAVIIAPDSIGRDWSTSENQRAVNALLDATLASYAIDSRKIAVTGYSMGGRGAWFWAGMYPDRFTAAIPVAGSPPSSVAGWRVPVFAVHSRDDEVVPIGPTEQRILDLKKMGKNAELVVVNGITHFETYRHVDGLRKAVPWLNELWK